MWVNKLFFGFLFFVLSTGISCTSARWTIKDKSAADPSDYEVLARHQFLQLEGEVSPENPVLQLDLYSRKEYEYSQKVLVQRNIQKYRLRPGLLALGLTGSALAFFAANSAASKEYLTTSKSVALNAAGGVLALSGLLHMKAVGEPQPTGEERFLRETGKVVNVDTVKVAGTADYSAEVQISYRDSVIYKEQNSPVDQGRLHVTLDDKLNQLQLEGSQMGNIDIQLLFNDSTYHFQYPLEKVLQPYAQVRSQLTELRNSPEVSPDNILADMLRGSRIKIQRTRGDQWYQVLYGGISDNYILQEDVKVIWRSADFARDDQIITVPQIPFGNVDVESNIPILRSSPANAVALIVTNENYSGDLSQRNYAHRDGRLIRTYLQNALGYDQDHIYRVSDASSSQQIYRKLSELRFATNDSTEVFVYLSGYGNIQRRGEEVELSMLNVADEMNSESNQELELREFFEQIASLSSSQTIVVADVDFSQQVEGNELTFREQQQVVERYTAELESDNEPASLLMGMRMNQPSGLYMSTRGEDKKHRIFPYYFAKALQNRQTALPALYQFLERNISYTSRRLHDRAQDPVLMGDVFLDLLGE